MLQPVRVFAVAAVGGTAAGLDVGGVPRLGAERAQERRRVEGAGADLQIERLDEDAALPRPVGVEALDQFLEGRSLHENGTRYGDWVV